MNKSAPIALTVLLLAGGAFANEIYKWTDEDGNVHFGDRPEGDVPESIEIVGVQSRNTDPESVSAAIEARQDRDQARADARQQRAEAQQEAAAQAAEASEKAALCDRYRATLESYVTSRRLYKLDENGERSYLDESQMQQARADLQKRIEDNCTG